MRSVIRNKQTLIAVIGAGPFGREHLRRLQKIAAIDAIGYLEPSTEHAALASTLAPSARRFHSLGELLEAKVDGAIVASQSDSHASIASQLLEADIPVLLEKPIATSLDDAHWLLKAELESNAFVLPGHILRFAEPYRKLHRRLQRGDIGDLIGMAFTKHRTLDHDVQYSSVHPILLTGIHDLDIALWLSDGVVSSVRSQETRIAGRAQPSIISSGITMNDGVAITFTNTWTVSPGKNVPDRVEAYGTNGMLQLELTSQFTDGGTDNSDGVFSDDGEDALKAEIEHFLRLISGQCISPQLSLHDAVRALELAEQIISSGMAK